ncbi:MULTISPECIES: DUF3147 family protein [Bacillales]|uniref:DUF3147 family protein n=3 Tax=Anoxybacillaceae TaxID=3120669 RepID=A0AB38QZ27_PARTM|nr:MULTISPECIES: DUF3147 family protein [Bacillaceae]KYD17975.1 hypothetical protein B4168_2536 [Anoxybacillus flavithermus]REK57203.1 MAG: DUF3147 domain-containing protein [Geobacillus sp.]AEH49356.1 hypothetical protein Geoth_3506 [Parageobacillus thermoglucosidasius C56-YS93]ALF09483.1 hypothetical protein AOT13_05350 [Parageobacillus thermoglucosidasius]ANZ29566.1 hypothetical protein BCV53_05360 [Parageobacillus thermoglucosidasius]
MDGRDLFFRFLFGGSAVVLSYVTAKLLPWKVIGGIFAAFPAVMVVAVMMVGMTKGSKEAAKIAQGSVYGMIGCFICVLTVLFSLQLTRNWWGSFIFGLISWFASSLFLVYMRDRKQEKRASSIRSEHV